MFMNRVFCANLMDSIWLYVYRDFSHRLKRIANLRTIGILHRWIWIFINRLKETEGFLQYYDGDDDVIPGYNNNTPMMFKRDFLCKKCIGKRVHSSATKYDNFKCTLHQNWLGGLEHAEFLALGETSVCGGFTGTVVLFHSILVDTVTKLCSSQRSLIPQSVHDASHNHTGDIYV